LAAELNSVASVLQATNRFEIVRIPALFAHGTALNASETAGFFGANAARIMD